MTRPLAGSPFGTLSPDDVRNIAFIAVGLVVLIAFFIASRVIAHVLTEQLRHRNMRTDFVKVGRRAVYVVVIGLGVLAAFSFAFQTANVTLAGILLATVVAALGLQELLQDYVSGYYVLLERHIRPGDRIEFDGNKGTVAEVRLRVTLLRTDDDDLVVVPNSELFSKPVRVLNRTPADAKKSEPQG